MDNNEISSNSSKSNFVNSLNASTSSNEAKRLEEKVKAYNKNVRSNNNLTRNMNQANNNFDNNIRKTVRTSTSLSTQSTKNVSSNNEVTNELDSKGSPATGVSKSATDADVSSQIGQKEINNLKRKIPLLNVFSRLLGRGRKETEEQSFDGGFTNISADITKKVKSLLIVMAIVFPVLFICLIMTSSLIYIEAIELGFADLLGSDSEEVEDKINKKKQEQENVENNNLNEEITDENSNEAAYFPSNNDLYVLNYNSNNNFMLSKLSSSNLILANSTTYLKRKYNEADLEQLEDFFPNVSSLSEKYEENLVYDFFFKMYNIYVFYRDTEPYNVELDLPLLMATLSVQTDDMNELFRSNLSADDRKVDGWVKPVDDYDYYKDWSNQVLSSTDSTHDMEILAQHMISRQVKESCKNSKGEETKSNILKDDQIGTKTLTCVEGEHYEVSKESFEVDNEKYNEFLKEFIEKKYYEKGQTISSNKRPGTVDNPPDTGDNPPDTGDNPPDTGDNQSNNVCAGQGSFIKYQLSDDQLLQLASVCQREQGSAKGAAAEASLMANRFELYGSKFGKGATGLYNYVRNSGWFAYSKAHMDSRDASQEVINAVRSVLVDGKRTLPGYVDEHDCISCSKNGAGDISSVTNNGQAITKTDRNSYKQFTSVIKNIYGSTYTFYSFPTEHSDPFGYTNNVNRKAIGDFYYDFDTGKAMGCSSNDITYTPNTSNGNWRNWKQCGASWSNITIPSSSSSICSEGCLLTSITIQIARSGTFTVVNPIDPGIAVKKYSFVNGGDFVWNSTTNLAPNFKYVTAIDLSGMNRASIAKKLTSYDPNRYYMVLAVSNINRNKIHHYVALDYVDLQTNEIYIIDPASNSDPKLYSVYKVYKAYIYEKKD